MQLLRLDRTASASGMKKPKFKFLGFWVVVAVEQPIPKTLKTPNPAREEGAHESPSNPINTGWWRSGPWFIAYWLHA